MALVAGLLKVGTGNSAKSKILIVVGEGNNADVAIKYSQVAKLAKSAHVQCFALLVVDYNLMGGRVRHSRFLSIGSRVSHKRESI